LYVGCYTPAGPAWYHNLFSRELSRYKKTSGRQVEINDMAMSPDKSAASWTIRKTLTGKITDTEFNLLRWDHIIKTDASRPLLKRTLLLYLTFLDFLFSGLWFRLFKVSWRFTLQVLYSYIALTLFVLVGVGIAWIVSPYLAEFGLSGWVHWLALAAIVSAVFYGLCWLDRWRNLYAQHMLDAYITSAMHVRHKREDMRELIDGITEKILDAERKTDADELLLIGHSFGAVNMLQATAQAMAKNPDFGKGGVKTSLLTFGSILPVMACHPLAGWLRDHVQRIAISPDVLWVDYQSRKDVISAFNFDPVRDIGLDIPEEEISAHETQQVRFRDLVSPEFYHSIRVNFFRLHFQYIKANDYPDLEYDFFDLISGPKSMYEQIGQTETKSGQ
jgi:hypothetical protein